jgi:hypothetical protein
MPTEALPVGGAGSTLALLLARHSIPSTVVGESSALLGVHGFPSLPVKLADDEPRP